MQRLGKSPSASADDDDKMPIYLNLILSRDTIKKYV